MWRAFPPLGHYYFMGKFDLTFKSLAESDPRSMIELFGGISNDQILDLRPLERELNLPIQVLDHAYLLETPAGKQIEHFEAQLRSGPDLRVRLPDYGMASWLKYRLPVYCTVVWMSPRTAPKRFPESVKAIHGGLEVTLKVRSVRAWELPVDKLLASPSPSVWPWVALASSNMDEVLEAGRRIQKEVADPRLRRQLLGEISVLGGLRYNRIEFDELLGRFHVFLSEEILKESVAIQMAEERGLEQGLQKGLHQGLNQGLQEGLEAGRLKEARRFLQLYLKKRFPAIHASARIREITDLARLEALASKVFSAATEAEARKVIARLG
ncbi:MAG: Rpn family recombination-promoting nuclease/putative transposase [Candidatus Solibacter usitatus]|nr:Rpn family recombination-promoting nuclease/putative transposase [Candidatus Solibacter usitatus]